MSMGGGFRPESPKVARRRRARSAQRETTEGTFLIHQPRLSAQVRSTPPPLRTEPARGPASIPRRRRSPPLRVTTSIIFSDRAFDLRASGSGRIHPDRPSMVMAGPDPKVPPLWEKSVHGWVHFGGGGVVGGGLLSLAGMFTCNV